MQAIAKLGERSGKAGALVETGVAAKDNDRKIDDIEFNVRDIARSRDFYGKAFGWTFTDYGPTYCEFTDGRLTGGFTTGGAVSVGGPLVILYAKPVFEFPGGRRFHFEDPDGYELAVWSAK